MKSLYCLWQSRMSAGKGGQVLTRVHLALRIVREKYSNSQCICNISDNTYIAIEMEPLLSVHSNTHCWQKLKRTVGLFNEITLIRKVLHKIIKIAYLSCLLVVTDSFERMQVKLRVEIPWYHWCYSGHISRRSSTDCSSLKIIFKSASLITI